MEARFQHDFSDVRLHTDSMANTSASAVNAQAYTVGRSIVFGAGAPSPKTASGRRLVAHELAHVVQQTRVGGGGSDAELEGEADRAAATVESGAAFAVRGTAAPTVQRQEAPAAGGVKERALQTLCAKLGIDSTSVRLLAAGIDGAVEGFELQWNEGGTGKRLGENFKKFSWTDLPALASGYVVGVIQGVVSPITDLFSISVMAEAARDFGMKLAESTLSGKTALKSELDEILATLSQMVEPVRGVWRSMKEKPLDTLRMLLGFAGSQNSMVSQMQQVAASVGKAGGGAIARSLEEPWQKTDKKNEPKFSFWRQTAQFLNQKAEHVGEALTEGPWAKVGNKAGYALGFAAVQVALLVFSEGIGNLITTIGRSLGTLAKAGTLLGRTLEGVGRFVQAAGSTIRVIEGAVEGVIGFLSKPFLPILEPILKPFGHVMDRLAKLLRRMLGMAEKEGSHLATTVVARTEGALTHSGPHAPTAHKPSPVATGLSERPHAVPPAATSHPGVPPSVEPTAPHVQPKEAATTAKTTHTSPSEPAASKTAPHEAPEHGPSKTEPSRPADTDQHGAHVETRANPPEARGKVAAEESVGEGHHVRVRESGDIELCSPEPCPLLENIYGDLIGGNASMKAKMDAIKRLRKSNPKLAASRSAALKKELDATRKKVDQEYKEFVDEMKKAGADPADINSRKAGKTAGSTAPRNDPLAQDIGVNIDEILPVGQKGLSLSEGRRRALSLDNRGMKEALLNQRTKHVGIDKREAAQLGKPRDPMSLKAGSHPGGDEHLALFDRRFSEIQELNEIGEDILKKMKGKTTRRPGDLKAELNSRIWHEIHKGTSANAVAVREALERSGFGLVRSPSKKYVMRALTEQELVARGLRFEPGEGWIKATAP